MVISCKNYLADHGKQDIRTLQPNEVIDRFNLVWKFYKYYKEQYKQTNFKIQESESETSMNLSEVYIFGKFKVLSKRMYKVKLKN